MKGIVGVTEEEMKNGEQEVFVDFRKKKEGEILIKLKDLSHKRKLLPEDNDNLSILRIFVDTISINRFYRRFPKTRKFLEQYIPSKNKNKAIYEFFRLHSIKGFTAPNLVASVYGFGDVKKRMRRIDSYASKRGYITGMTRDICNYNEVGAKGSLYSNKSSRPGEICGSSNNGSFHGPAEL